MHILRFYFVGQNCGYTFGQVSFNFHSKLPERIITELLTSRPIYMEGNKELGMFVLILNFLFSSETWKNIRADAATYDIVVRSLPRYSKWAIPDKKCPSP